MSLPERCEPTHTLVVRVPLNLGDDLDFDPIKDTVALVLGVSRAAYSNAICDDPEISLFQRDQRLHPSSTG